MKKAMVVVAAAVAFSCAAVLGTVATAPAQQGEQKCELGTQGALAWAIATLIDPNMANSGPEAIEKLDAMGIRPVNGWGAPTDCVTSEIKVQLQEAAAAVLRGTVNDLENLVGKAQQTILSDRGTTVSPH